MTPRRRIRPTAPAAAAAAGLLALAVGLSGCSSSGDTGEDNAAPASAPASASAAPESAPAETAAGAPHAAVTAALESALGKLAAANPAPGRDAVMEAFTSAGFPADAVEVSADRTPTGLDVDSIQAAAVHDGECIFGEVRDGAATVTVLPPLSDGSCFVGN